MANMNNTDGCSSTRNDEGDILNQSVSARLETMSSAESEEDFLWDIQRCAGELLSAVCAHNRKVAGSPQLDGGILRAMERMMAEKVTEKLRGVEEALEEKVAEKLRGVEDRLLQRVDERMLEVEQRFQDRVEEGTRRMEQMEERLLAVERQASETMESLRRSVEERLEQEVAECRRELEQRLQETVDGRVRSLAEESAAVSLKLQELQRKVEDFEGALGRALGEFVPRVDAVLSRVEGAGSLQPSRAPCQGVASSEKEQQLRDAAKVGAAQRVRELILEGVDVEAPDNNDCTALHCAALKGHLEALQALLEAGANANAKNAYGYTPLHLAVSFNKPSHLWSDSAPCVDALVRAGARVEERNCYGQTALFNAVYLNKHIAIKALLAAGADATAPDNWGKRPLELTESNAIRCLVWQ